MCIMAVDADKMMLRDFESKLHIVFPEEQIVTFHSPLEALKYAEANRVDILFTDVRLKPIDGYELIKAIRKKQQCFAYVVSGSKEAPDNLNWMAVNGCFTKPAALEELKQLRIRHKGEAQDES